MLSRLWDFILDRAADNAKQHSPEARFVLYGYEAAVAALAGLIMLTEEPVPAVAALIYSGITLALWSEYNRTHPDGVVSVFHPVEQIAPPGLAASLLAICYGLVLSYPMLAGPALLNNTDDVVERVALVTALITGCAATTYVTARAAGRTYVTHALCLGVVLVSIWAGMAISVGNLYSTPWSIAILSIPIPVAISAGRLRERQVARHIGRGSAVV